MKNDQSFRDFVVDDLMASDQGVTSKYMFGGWGIFKNGNMFGLIADGLLHLKVDEKNQADFEEIGSKPFMYVAKDKEMKMSYWSVPEDLLEDRGAFEKLMDGAVAVAKRAKKK